MTETEDAPPESGNPLHPKAGGRDVDADMARTRLRAKLFPSFAKSYRIGRYVIRDKLGEGGMGVVLRAYDPQLDRDVALKIVRDENVGADRAQKRLLREARSIAKLQHPNVVSVFDCGVEKGSVYIAMELIVGTPLGTWLAQHLRTMREVLGVFLQAGAGLSAAHRAGLVHRDFKPSNVLLGGDGQVKVLDFGLALSGFAASVRAGVKTLDGPSSEASDIAGTPAYMSPEQFTGLAVDVRTDQYSFCVALYEALFGVRPFVGDELDSLSESVMRSDLKFPRGASVAPTALRDLLARGLSRQRELRFASMRELLTELRAVEAAMPDTLTAITPVMHRALEPPSVGGPRANRYAAQLPGGVLAHPHIVMTAELVHLVLAHKPLDKSRVAIAHRDLFVHLEERMVPVGVGRVILAEVFDQHQQTLETWAEFVRGPIRAGFTARFMTFFMGPGSPRSAAETAARVWTICHRGLAMEVVTCDERTATLRVTYPPHLLDALAHQEAKETVRVALEMCRVRSDVVIRATSAEALLLEVRWEARA